MNKSSEWRQVVETILPILLGVRENNASFEEATAEIGKLGNDLPSDVQDFLINSIWELNADTSEFARTVNSFADSGSVVEFRAYMNRLV
jgi:hypothetical protein